MVETLFGMSEHKPPVSVVAADVAPRAKKSVYPEPFAARVDGREKRVLGDLFHLTNFGVNRTTLKPGAMSALRHAHAQQDEFIYVLEGTPTLITNQGAMPLKPGDCAGFKAGNGDAHHLVNRGDVAAVYLEIGDRTVGDTVNYPDDDLLARFVEGAWLFTHKDGTPY
jgi:uncharacterized cupin superfamily protein